MYSVNRGSEPFKGPEPFAFYKTVLNTAVSVNVQFFVLCVRTTSAINYNVKTIFSPLICNRDTVAQTYVQDIALPA